MRERVNNRGAVSLPLILDEEVIVVVRDKDDIITTRQRRRRVNRDDSPERRDPWRNPVPRDRS